MQDVLQTLGPDDYAFVVGILESTVNFTDTAALQRHLRAYRAEPSAEHRAALDRQLDHELRYLGSADAAYFVRFVLGGEPGVAYREVVRDVARHAGVDLPRMGTDRELTEALAEGYVTRQFAGLSAEEQQRMLEDLGVDRREAAAFVKRSAGVFALPLLLQAFNAVVVEGLVKRVIFGTIARLVGSQLAGRLFTLLMGRVPWWVGWIGPAAWTLSIGWTAVDLQGPAYRKTVPAVLYLGLCTLRDREGWAAA